MEPIAHVTSDTLVENAHAVLRQLTGNPEARFRDGQLEAILALVRDRKRVLVVQKTGWGKSAVYFVAAKLLRAMGAGPTLIISPLLALMRDQIAAAGRAGVRAATLNSSNVTVWDEVVADLTSGNLDVLLVSPERLSNPDFRDRVLGGLLAGAGMIVVDEAHCISDWGHDFRPDYRQIGSILATLPHDLPVLATTATANSRVVADVAEQLGSDTMVVRGPLARESLRLGVGPTWDPATRIAWLVDHLRDFPGSGIVYTLTVSAAQDTAEALRRAGYEAAPYSGGTDPAEREELEARLKDNELKALVATSALGMGFDKPDLGFVIHLGAPSSAVAYYQQVGRAGRGTDHADVLLLPGVEDPSIWEYFATASMPREESASAVLAALAEAPGPLSVARLETFVDEKRGRLELLLKTLQVDGAIARVKGGYVSTGVPWVYDAQRYAHVLATRQREARAMLEYESGKVCRMRFLVEALDDPEPHDCGKCDVCAGPWWDSSVSQDSVSATRAELDSVGVPVKPRALWPSGLDRIGVPLSGRIPAELQAAEGRVIARMTDLGAGQTLREFLAPGAADLEVPGSIGAWCLRVLGEWRWEHRPECVLAIPSVTRPVTVTSLAANLAAAGRLTDLGVLDLVHETGEVDLNSAFRVKNVHDAFRLTEEQASAVAGRSVLLVDDEIVSGWTMTVVARLLREAGATAVLPFALAQRR